MARRVFIHVGAPKTGAWYVRTSCSSREFSASRGSLPAERHDARFLVALDLMDLPWVAWSVRPSAPRTGSPSGPCLDGAAIISRESSASPRGSTSPGRSPRSATPRWAWCSRRATWSARSRRWQEASSTGVRRPSPPSSTTSASRTAAARWRSGLAVQEVPDVLDRWGTEVPREQVHLVTVPPFGSAPTLLWERSRACSVRRRALRPTDRANASLGIPESTMVRA